MIPGPWCVRDHQHQLGRYRCALAAVVGLVAWRYRQPESEPHLRQTDSNQLYVPDSSLPFRCHWLSYHLPPTAGYPVPVVQS